MNPNLHICYSRLVINTWQSSNTIPYLEHWTVTWCEVWNQISSLAAPPPISATAQLVLEASLLLIFLFIAFHCSSHPSVEGCRSSWRTGKKFTSKAISFFPVRNQSFEERINQISSLIVKIVGLEVRKTVLELFLCWDDRMAGKPIPGKSIVSFRLVSDCWLVWREAHCLRLTFSLPRMINFKFSLKPDQKYSVHHTVWRTWVFIA